MSPPKPQQPSPLRLASLAGAGFGLVGSVAAGLLIGVAIAKYLHWTMAIPIFLVLGFVTGFVSMYRRLTQA